MLSETKTSHVEKVKISIPSVRIVDDDVFKMDMTLVRKVERKLTSRLRHELLEFATKNKTRRVYVVTVMNFDGTSSGVYYMPFPYDNRSMAYIMRDSLENANVVIYDFSPIIDCQRPLQNEDEKKLWEAFNRCCRCDRPRPCKDGTYLGKPVRMCEECIEELTSFRTVKKK